MKLQTKLLVVYVVVAIVVATLGTTNWYALKVVADTSRDATERQVPLIRSIQEALIALASAQAAADGALDVEDFAHIEDSSAFEAKLRRAIISFDMYMAAITWGSESDAFVRSAGGINSREWERSGLRGDLIVYPVTDEQIQRAGMASLSFAGFANNMQKAIAANKRGLRLVDAGDRSESAVAQEQVHEARNKAQSYAQQAIDQLEVVAVASNEKIEADTITIRSLQQVLLARIIAIGVIGTVIVFIVSLVLTSKIIVRPVEELKATADAFGAGDFTKRVRTTTTTTTTTIQDEIEALGVAFNTMAGKIQESQETLEQRVKDRTAELEKINALMIGRELKMIELKKEIETLRKSQKKS